MTEKEENIIRVSKEEWKQRKGKTDWERVDNLTDSEIEQAVANDPDAAPILDEDDDFWKNAEVVTYKNDKRKVIRKPYDSQL